MIKQTLLSLHTIMIKKPSQRLLNKLHHKYDKTYSIRLTYMTKQIQSQI